jgi:hypothetical protein
MDLATTAVFYAVIGVGVAVAQYLRSDSDNAAERLMQVGLAASFWPLYLPLVLRPSGEAAPQPASNRFGPIISQIERELDVAWKGLDGWAEQALCREADRLSDLRATWRAQAERIHQLDQLLAATATTSMEEFGSLPGDNSRARQSVAARDENLQRLRALRQQMSCELTGTLAWVRELATMIHLARFTGAPAARADGLVAQIAAAVEGISEVQQWHSEESGNRPMPQRAKVRECAQDPVGSAHDGNL